MSICGTTPRYHGSSGTSRGYLLVRQGAANSVRVFLPSTPPTTVRGMVTRDQSSTRITIVPNGRAAVDCAQGRGRARGQSGLADAGESA